VVWPGTRCMAWDCGQLGKVPHVRIGMVVGLERFPEYEIGCNWYLVYNMVMLMA
jgi:hypothetical protein